MASRELQHMILCQLREIHPGWIMLDPGCYQNTALTNLPEIKLLPYEEDQGEVLFCDDSNERCILHDVEPNSLVLIVDGEHIYMWREDKLRAALCNLAGLGVGAGAVFDDSGDYIGQKISLCFAYGALEAVFDCELGQGYAPWSVGQTYPEFFGPKVNPRAINVVAQ